MAAVLLQSFSIREYTAGIRAVDVAKCWPFGGEVDGGLPPIQIRKFRWWSDELETARSIQEPTVDIEREKAKATRSSRSKQKAPKKRSITELFAVAPQVAVARSVARMEKGDKAMASEAEEDENMRKRIWIKKKFKNNKKKKDRLAIKRGKIHKPKMSSSTDTSPLLKGLVCKKRSGKALKGPGKRLQKVPTVRSITSKTSGKNIQRKLTGNKQLAEKALPIHGILKNQTRPASGQTKSVIGDAQGESLLKSCRALVKHVTFSGKDDILGHSKKVSPLKLPPLQTLCKIFSNVLAASSATNDSRKGETPSYDTEGAQLVNGSNKDVPVDVIDGTVGSLSDSFNQDTASIDPPKRNCSDLERPPLCETVDLNSTLPMPGDLNCSYSGNTQSPSLTLEEGVNAVGNNAREGNSGTHITRSFCTPIEGCVSRSDPTFSFNIARNVVSQPPTSCLMTRMHNNGKESHISIGPKMGYISSIPELQRKCNFSSNDIMSSICSSVGSNTFGESRQASLSMRSHADKCINEDFVGLPLNSQGELMKLCSSSKYGFRDLLKKQNTAVGSPNNFQLPSSSEPNSKSDLGNMKLKFPCASQCQKDRSTWFLEQYCPASRDLTSGLGITGTQNFDRREIHRYESAKNQNQNIHHIPNQINFSQYGHWDQTHIRRDKEKFHEEGNLDDRDQLSPPTMRLMGKNVTVGKISNECHGVRDENMWTDKEIVSEQSVRVSDKTQYKGWPQREWVTQRSASGTSNGNFFQQLEPPGSIYFPAIQTSCERMPFNYRMPYDCGKRWMSNNGISSTNENPGFQFYTPSHSLHRKVLQNATSNTIFNYNSATEPVEMGHQIPVVAPHTRDLYQHMLLRSNHCKHSHSQGIPYSASSISHPPFANQESGTFGSSLSAAHSSSHICQCLLNPKEQKQNQINSSPYSDIFARQQPSAMPATNFLSFPSSHPTSTFSFPLHGRNVIAPSSATSAQHSPVPAYPTSNSSCTVNASYKSKTVKGDGTNSKIKYVEDLERADRSRKRPADRSDGFMRPAKKLSQTAPWNSYASMQPRRREQLHQDIPYSAETPKKLTAGYTSIDMDHPIINSNTGLFGSSSKIDGRLRAGPVKLSAGAKHILEPSQSTDRDNSKLIHSTIPFEIGSSSYKVPVSLKKSTKIYKF